MKTRSAFMTWLTRIGFYTFSTGFAQVLMFLYLVLVARQLGSDPFGLFAGTYALVSLLGIFFGFGLDTWQLRSASGGTHGKAFTTHILLIKFGAGLAWGGLVIWFLPGLRPDIYPPGILIPAVIDIIGDGLITSIIIANNVAGKVRTAGTMLVVSRLARVASAGMLVALDTMQPESFALARMLATWLVFIVFLFINRPVAFPLQQPYQKTIRQSAWYWISDILAAVYLQADVTLLAWLAGEQAVGQYSPASNLVNATFVLSNAGYVLFVPQLVKIANQQISEFRKQIQQMFLWFSLLGVSLFIVTYSFSTWIIGLLFGSSYNQSGLLLAILSPLILLKPYEYGFVAILVARDRQRERLIPQILSALANLVANLVLIPRFGALGAAYAYLSSELVLVAGYGILSARELVRARKENTVRV